MNDTLIIGNHYSKKDLSLIFNQKGLISSREGIFSSDTLNSYLFFVDLIKKGFESGDHLSLVKVSRLIGHSSVSTTLRYTNFETNQMLDLYELS
jgi:hypothetical protein